MPRNLIHYIINISKKYHIPIITSLLARDYMSYDENMNFGFLGGAYGMRIANLLATKKTDLLRCLGISLGYRQTGNREQFSLNKTIFRIDIEKYKNNRHMKGEIYYQIPLEEFIPLMNTITIPDFKEWYEVARNCRIIIKEFDYSNTYSLPNNIIEKISDYFESNSVCCVDVGQHMMWAAHSVHIRSNQRLLFSGGHGAMGYSLPAAIGACIHNKKRTFCICGDGSLQMNIQELQWVYREKLPVKIIVFNNRALGMIRFLQKDYFDNRFEGTSFNYNYESCVFYNVAKGFNIRAAQIYRLDEIEEYEEYLKDELPFLLEIVLSEDTNAYPKTYLGEKVYNQRPYLEKDVLQKLVEM